MELAPPCNKVHDAKSDNFICYGPYSSQELQNDTGSATSPPMSTINQHLNIKFLMYFKPLYSDTWCTFVMLKIRLKRKKTVPSCTYNFKHRDLVQLQGFLGRFADSEEIILGGRKGHLYIHSFISFFLF